MNTRVEIKHFTIQERATRVRVSKYVKIATGRNFPPVLKIVTYTAWAA